MVITFYDIPSTLPGKAWSPATWKIRLCLNYKGIPYKTEWVEYPDIEAHSKAHGIGPTGKNDWNGGDLYSLPAIHDTTTGVYLADSWEIAKYLDKQYPETPAVFPSGTIGLHAIFTDAYSAALSPLFTFIVPLTPRTLNPRSAKYFIETRTQLFGVPLEDVLPKGETAVTQWADLKASLEKAHGWFEHTDGKGQFMLGETFSWSDIVVASFMRWIKATFGENSKEWTDISSWQEGRWGNLMKAVEKYMAVL